MSNLDVNSARLHNCISLSFRLNFSKDINIVKIVTGTNKWKSGTKYLPKKFMIHEKYNDPRFAYDVGLIQLQTSIEFNYKTQPIKLSKEFIKHRANLTVSRWGYIGVSTHSQFLLHYHRIGILTIRFDVDFVHSGKVQFPTICKY